MQASIVYWLRARMRANPPIAADEYPASAMQDEMEKLSRHWGAKFDEAARVLGEYFGTAQANRSDAAFQAGLKRAGFVIDFQMTPPMEDALIATIEQQVGLIRSIGAEHLSDVQGLVMRSVTEGRGIGDLSKALVQRYNITKRRAALIARDQNAKATATFERVRMLEVGITQARWVHTGAGKHPRPEHVAFSAGKHKGSSGPIYDIAKGAFLEGEWVWPGTAINCRCFSRPIIRSLEE